MGNYRFKLSDMMPNSWLYKLRDTLKSSSTSPDSNTKKPKQQLPEGRAHKSHHQHLVPRQSCHFTRELGIKGSVSHSETTLSGIGYFPKVNSPRHSTNKRRTKARKSRSEKQKPPRLVSSSVPAGCSCKATLGSVWAKAEQVSLLDTESSGSETDISSSVELPLELELPQSFDQIVSLSTSSCSCGIKSGSNDIAFDVSKISLDPENDLSPIPTSPLKFTDMVKNVRQPDDANTDIQHALSVKVKRELPSLTAKEHLPTSPKLCPVIKEFTINSPGVKLRINSNSSRVVSLSQQKKPQGEGGHQKSNTTEWSSTSLGLGNQRIRRRRMSDSFAVVKKSADPKTDFKESMVEMIKENNIKTSKDLEELLACYLTLNSDEYHDVIITVFKQIWFDIGNIS